MIFKLLILNKRGVTTIKTEKTRMTTLKSKFEFITNSLNEALLNANTTQSEQILPTIYKTKKQKNHKPTQQQYNVTYNKFKNLDNM